MGVLFETSLVTFARGVFVALAIFFVLWCYSRRDSLSKRSIRAVSLIASGIAGIGLARCIYVTLTNLLSPREWDFLCFWTFGRALAIGGSPYDEKLLRELALPHGPSVDFQELAYCLYPPPGVVQFWPLGYMPVTGALILWYAVQWMALGVTLLIFRRFIDPDRTRLGWAVAAALVFGLHSTASTFVYAQSNFLVLALATCCVIAKGSTSRGLLLGAAAVVKPIAVLFALPQVARFEWRTLAAVLLPIVAAMGLYTGIQGWSGITRYRDRNPLSDEIAYTYYTEPTNQSLLAVVLRTRDSKPASSPIATWPFVTIGLVLTAITFLVVWRLPQPLRETGLGCSIALALLVYPGTLTHYSVLLLLPVGQIFAARRSIPGGPTIVTLCIASAYGLVWADLAFFANLSVWLAMMIGLGMGGIRRIIPGPP